MTEDETVGWHHRLNVHKLEQTLGDGEGQGSLVCCSSWGHKESDMTQQLNNGNKQWDLRDFVIQFSLHGAELLGNLTKKKKNYWQRQDTALSSLFKAFSMPESDLENWSDDKDSFIGHRDSMQQKYAVIISVRAEQS